MGKDPWQDGQRIAVVQCCAYLAALAEDGSWGPDRGRVYGSKISIFGCEARWIDGNIQWANGNVWDRVTDDSDDTNVNGTYSDPWQNGERTIILQSGAWIVAVDPGGYWEPEYGTIKGSKLEIFEQDAEFADGCIKWANGNAWPRISLGS